MKRAILIHYHEINLKKNNRGWFESRLQQHLQAALSDLPHGGVSRFAGRMQILLLPDSPVERITERLRRVFGIANFATAFQVAAELSELRSSLALLVREKTFRSFRIHARRSTKDFPLNSQQINENLGHMIQELTGARVDLETPELTCYVEIVGRNAFLYFERVAAGGGLPSRTGGKVVCLLSGGIDSPVAAYRIMRRGCHVIFVHFHSFPHTTIESQEKVRKIVQVLARFQLDSRLHMIPFGDVQREIVAYSPPKLRVVLYRRFMLRIAEAVALQDRATGLITGDSLGQVASQTIENLRTVSAAVNDLPVFRPLIGDDKEDIIRIAREIGTYDISILPDQDCCTMFVPRHPETMSSTQQADRAEASLDVQRLVESALHSGTLEVIAPDFSPVSAGVV